jgi:hypothetical protein
MSADNGVYILKTRGAGLQAPFANNDPQKVVAPFYEYRVLHAQAIENIYYRVEAQSDQDLFDQSNFVPEVAYEYFKECQPLYDEGQALSYAHKLSEQYSILEYGVEILDHGEQVFQTFTDEEIQAHEQRYDEIMAANRIRRDAEMEAKRSIATVKLAGDGSGFHPTQVTGFIAGPNGERIYGRLNLTTEEFERVKVGHLDQIELSFLPHDWDRR